MMPRDDIESLQNENRRLKDNLEFAEEAIHTAYLMKCENCYKGVCMYCSNRDIVHYRRNSKSRHRENCEILARKLLEAKPELEEWVKLNFGEYL